MLKAGNLSHALTEISSRLSTLGCISASGISMKLEILFVSYDGQLISSSSPNSSQDYESCRRISAVCASIAVEYGAIDRLMDESLNSFVLQTDSRVVLCSDFCHLKAGVRVLLVLSVSRDSKESELSTLGMLRSLGKRLKQDLQPCINPILENMISSSQSE